MNLYITILITLLKLLRLTSELNSIYFRIKYKHTENKYFYMLVINIQKIKIISLIIA